VAVASAAVAAAAVTEVDAVDSLPAAEAVEASAVVAVETVADVEVAEEVHLDVEHQGEEAAVHQGAVVVPAVVEARGVARTFIFSPFFRRN
jgi:predicted amino acid racemase